VLVEQFDHSFNIYPQSKHIRKQFFFWLQASKNSHILAVSDEDGYVSLFDTRRKFQSSASQRENAGLINFEGFDCC
jgi:hypothetical protein